MHHLQAEERRRLEQEEELLHREVPLHRGELRHKEEHLVEELLLEPLPAGEPQHREEPLLKGVPLRKEELQEEHQEEHLLVEELRLSEVDLHLEEHQRSEEVLHQPKGEHLLSEAAQHQEEPLHKEEGPLPEEVLRLGGDLLREEHQRVVEDQHPVEHRPGGAVELLQRILWVPLSLRRRECSDSKTKIMQSRRWRFLQELLLRRQDMMESLTFKRRGRHILISVRSLYCTVHVTLNVLCSMQYSDM